jgi:hypothetical protein
MAKPVVVDLRNIHCREEMFGAAAVGYRWRFPRSWSLSFGTNTADAG